MHTAESNFSNFVIEFENALACLAGAQVGSNHGKKIEVENLMTYYL